MKHSIFIPAYGDGTIDLLYKNTDQEIKKKLLGDFKDKKSLRIFNPTLDTYFKCPYMLVSAGYSYKRKDLRKKLKANKSTVFIDSGGFQLAMGTVNHTKYIDKVALEWSESNGDIFPILDRPSFNIGKGKCPYKSRKECLDLSVASAKYYYENRTRSDTYCLNVLQGKDRAEYEKWYKNISKWEFDGWGVGGSRGNVGRMVTALLVLLRKKELERDGCKYVHFFGVSSNEIILYIEWMQRVLNNMNIDVQLTYDATTWNRTLIYGGYFITAKYNYGIGMESISFKSSFDYSKMDKNFRLPCDCPICGSIKDTYNFFNRNRKKSGEFTERWNNTICFHNLYLQLSYIKKVRSVLYANMSGLLKEVFGKKVYQELSLISRVLRNPKKDIGFSDLHTIFIRKSEMVEKKKKKVDVSEGVLPI